MGDENENETMEKLCLLDTAVRSGGTAVRMADEGWCTALHRYGHEACADTAGDRLSYRLDNSVRPDGHRRCQSGIDTAFGRAFQCAITVFAAAGIQLPLEHHLLYLSGIRGSADLVDRPLGADPFDDSCVPEGGPIGGEAADSLSYLGDLCGLSQCRGVAVEPMRVRE